MHKIFRLVFGDCIFNKVYFVLIFHVSIVFPVHAVGQNALLFKIQSLKTLSYCLCCSVTCYIYIYKWKTRQNTY